MSVIYLDNNSTTPILPEVAAAIAECHIRGYANPASQHSAGRKARQRLEQAREEIGRILGADLGKNNPDRLVFTSGGTEANNLAILGLAATAESTLPAPHEAIVSSIEHPSVLGPVEVLERRGWRVHRAAATSDGVVCLNDLQSLLNERTRLVSVMLANNETGVLQPIRAISKHCLAASVPLHTDAAQVAGKIPLSFADLGVYAMSVAAHKFHGPLGIGALILRHDTQIQPTMFGGFQQTGLRPGTESVALAVGMEAALLAYEREEIIRTKRIRQLRDRFESTLLAGYPALIFNGFGAERLPGTTNLAFVGQDRQQLLLALDLAGVCCSTGSACASGSSEPSPVLKAMQLPSDVVGSSLRFSLGATTTETEIDDAALRILKACERTGKL